MKVTLVALIIFFVAILYLTQISAASSIRTKREELRKLQRKRKRAQRREPGGPAVDELDRLIGALQDEIDGIVPKAEEAVPPPLSKNIEDSPTDVPRPTHDDASSVREYIKEWRSTVRIEAKERVARLLHRVKSIPAGSCRVLNSLHKYIERISRLENDLAGIYEAFGLRIGSASSVEKVRELREERARQEGPVFEELSRQRLEFEGALLGSC